MGVDSSPAGVEGVTLVHDTAQNKTTITLKTKYFIRSPHFVKCYLTFANLDLLISVILFLALTIV